MRCAKKYLWDKDIAVAAVGRVEGLMDYSRVRLTLLSVSARREPRLTLRLASRSQMRGEMSSLLW